MIKKIISLCVFPLLFAATLTMAPAQENSLPSQLQQSDLAQQPASQTDPTLQNTPSVPSSQSIQTPTALEAPEPQAQSQPQLQPQSQPLAPAQAQPQTQSAPAVQNLSPSEPEPAIHDLTPWGMFVAADRFVQSIMIILVLACLLTWTILIAKGLEIASAKRQGRNTLKIVLTSTSLKQALNQLQDKKGISQIMAQSTFDETRLSLDAVKLAGNEGIKERITSRLSRLEHAETRRIGRGTAPLATIGSIAPFVGLLGTVWGIMNSFIGIAETKTTNLAVVAPGIAEALLATAMGLAAAIPAVVIYNLFARSISGYRQLLGDISAGLERLVSRDLDYYKTGRDPLQGE